MGMIYKRGNTWWIKYYRNGKCFRESRELSALKRMLNLGAKQTPLKVNRVPHIPMLKENNTREAIPAYIRPFVIFGYKVGWRDKEIAFLKWGENVDLASGIVTLKVGETKNDEARTVYLDEELKGLFEEQQRT